MYKIALLVNEYQQKMIFEKEHYEKLGELGELFVYDRADFSDREYVLEFVKSADIIIESWGSPALDAELLSACPELKCIIYGAGTVKPIVTPEFIEKKIPITESKIVDSCNVGITTLGLAIAACKGAFFLPDDLRKGLWRENYDKVKDFQGIKIGVIGAGVAGCEFIRLLHNFEVEIFVYDPTLNEKEVSDRFGASKCDLPYLMSHCDVISLHAPTLPSTKNMINAEMLSLMQDGAIFINTARGWLVDEKALIEECKKKRFTAILDVTDSEPVQTDNPLRSLENVVLLPHIAGTTNNGKKFIGRHVCEEAERFVSGKPLQSEVDLTKLSVLA